jgi:hypothetical protein
MLDFHLRILSMCIGIIVGLASLAKLIYDVWFNTSNHNRK